MTHQAPACPHTVSHPTMVDEHDDIGDRAGSMIAMAIFSPTLRIAAVRLARLFPLL